MESGQLLYYIFWGEAESGILFEIKGIVSLKIDKQSN